MNGVRDPLSDSNIVKTGNPQTGKSSLGGYMDPRGVDLGDGTAATVVLVATRTPSTVNASTSSVQALAADPSRIAATIVNNEASIKIYVGVNGAAAVVGTNPIPAGGAYSVPSQYAQGKVSLIWDTGGTVAASVMATTA